MNISIFSLFDEIVSYKEETIYIDICNIKKKLKIFDVIELMSFILNKYQWKNIKKLDLIWEWKNHDYLEKINFKYNLEKLFWLNVIIEDNIFVWKNNLLEEIKVFSNKNEFYSINQKILDMLSSIWLNDDSSYLILSSLWEIIDNSFYHNLWRWEILFWPTCIFLIENDIKNKKLSFVISDLGIWFSNTLKNNYPLLRTEKECIENALKPWITWRYQNKWWNWLVYLQKNIFNWFDWELYIRSNNLLVKVKSF